MKRLFIFAFLLSGISISCVYGMDAQPKDDLDVLVGDIYTKGTAERDRLDAATPLLSVIADPVNLKHVVKVTDGTTIELDPEEMRALITSLASAFFVDEQTQELTLNVSKLDHFNKRKKQTKPNRFLAALTSPYGQAGTAVFAVILGFAAGGYLKRK